MSLALPEETALVIPESLNEQDFENLAKLTGQDDFAKEERIPRLSIEQSSDDNDGNPVPRGKYRLWVDSSNYYMDTPVVRLFLRMFGYSVYDPSENRFANRTVLKPSLRDVFPDIQGVTSAVSYLVMRWKHLQTILLKKLYKSLLGALRLSMV